MLAKMDELDDRLLRELSRDGRAPVSALARRLKVPRSTVKERLDRLIKLGVIKRFEAVLDHNKLGQPTIVYILASFMPGTGGIHREVARDLMRIPGVEAVAMISGEWDLLLRVRGASMEAVGNLIVDRLRTIPSIARTLSMGSFYCVE